VQTTEIVCLRFLNDDVFRRKSGAEALQALVTPETFEGINTQLEEVQREKQRIIDQRERISQGKSSARLAS
jgi:hypothetical protein